MAAITTLISLLPVFFAEYQELKVINDLNNYFNFDHNIFLLDSSVDKNLFIRRHVTPQSINVFKSVGDNITGLESLTNITSKNTFTVVALSSSNFKNNLKLLKRLKEIQQLQINIKIGIFFTNHASTNDLQYLFKWCKQQLIVNIFAATYSQPEKFLNIFSFHPFRTFEVTNVTSETYDRYFLSLDSNFHLQNLRLGASFFYYSNEQLWTRVLERMNATGYVVNLDHNLTQSEAVENRSEFLPQMYQIVENSGYQVYPLQMETHMIIVPEAQPYSEFSAYLLTLTSDGFFGYSLITIVAVILVLSVIRYIKRKKILFFGSVVDVLNLLMNDNSFIKYQRLSGQEMFLILPLTFVGFLIVNGILSNLQSYLTRPVHQPEINTIEEIYRSPFPILTWSPDWKTKLCDVLTNITEYSGWDDKVIGLEWEQYHEQSIRYNRSVSLISSEKYTNLLLGIQKRLNIKGYRNPQIQLFRDLYSYKVRPNFLFFDRLNEIIHWVQTTGLYELWQRKERYQFAQEIVKANVERLKNENTAVENFEFPMLIIYGWIGGVIVLIIEIIWKNFKLSWMKTVPRALLHAFVQKLRSFHTDANKSQNIVE